MSVCQSIRQCFRPHRTTLLPLDGFPRNLILEGFSKLRREYLIFIKILQKITGTLHEDRYTFLLVSCQTLIRMRNVSDKSCRENQDTHFVFNNKFLFKKNRAVCEIM